MGAVSYTHLDVYKRQDLCARTGRRPRVIYMTPQGRVFTQQIAEELAREEELVFLCGHYEGIDERALELVATDYLSIGDYVLTGGELPAMVMIDCISRLVPGVLNNEVSAEVESCHDKMCIRDRPGPALFHPLHQGPGGRGRLWRPAGLRLSVR